MLEEGLSPGHRILADHRRAAAAVRRDLCPLAASTASWRACAVAEPLLQISRTDQAFRRRARLRSTFAGCAGGRTACRHWAERRRQGPHPDRPACWRDHAQCRFEFVFEGRDITRLPPHRRSALGLARSFQITSLFSRFHRARQTFHSRCRPIWAILVPLLWGAPRRSGERIAHPGPGPRWARVGPRKAAPMRFVPTSATASIAALEIRHGARGPQRRACCCSMSPMAGMGPDESSRMVAAAGRAKNGSRPSC